MEYVISSTTRLNGSEKENEAPVRRGLEISSKWTRSEALIGKSIGDFTIDDLQRCIDTLNAEVAAAQAEVDALQAEIGRRKLGLQGQRNDDSDINDAVQAWLDDAPDCADRINALPVDERRKALARLGYDTPYYWGEPVGDDDVPWDCDRHEGVRTLNRPGSQCPSTARVARSR